MPWVHPGWGRSRHIPKYGDIGGGGGGGGGREGGEQFDENMPKISKNQGLANFIDFFRCSNLLFS